MRGQKKVKNLSEDDLGNKLGRVHIQSQQIQTIQTRKVKALKESKEEKLEKVQEKKTKAESARKSAVEKVFGAEDDAGTEMDDE